MCCITQARPCEVGALPLGRSSVLAGAPCIMQDTRNSYLKPKDVLFRLGIFNGVAWAGGGGAVLKNMRWCYGFGCFVQNVFSRVFQHTRFFLLIGHAFAMF